MAAKKIDIIHNKKTTVCKRCRYSLSAMKLKKRSKKTLKGGVMNDKSSHKSVSES